MKIIQKITPNKIINRIKYYQNISEEIFQKTSIVNLPLDTEVYRIMNCYISFSWMDELNEWNNTKEMLNKKTPIALNNLYNQLSKIKI